MKTTLLALFVSIAAGASSALAAGDSYFVYKVSANIPVMRVINVGGVDKIETRKVTGNDMVNIGLDRLLGFPVNKETEILAVAVNEAFPMTPTAKLILWNASSQTPTILAPFSGLTFDFASLNNGAAGFGLGQGDLPETTAGMVPKGKNFATTIFAAGTSKGNAPDPFNFKPQGTCGASSLFGKVKFIYTVKKGQTEVTDTFEGFVLNGMMKGSGKPIGTFTD